MVGRDTAEITATELLRLPDVRLLTLTGPGGIGKLGYPATVAGPIGCRGSRASLQTFLSAVPGNRATCASPASSTRTRRSAGQKRTSRNAEQPSCPRVHCEPRSHLVESFRLIRRGRCMLRAGYDRNLSWGRSGRAPRPHATNAAHVEEPASRVRASSMVMSLPFRPPKSWRSPYISILMA